MGEVPERVEVVLCSVEAEVEFLRAPPPLVEDVEVVALDRVRRVPC